ncbi:hypothetical protein [Halorientalis halophila]|uniref:hypothetical protein n=1 Tax=Halorientalis halophila TaxID=3108499 RepID=UPI00300B6862
MTGGVGQSRRVSDAVTEQLLDGALIGAGAYLAGYVITFAFAVVDGFEVAGDLPLWKAAGWVFYGAHTVRIESSSGATGDGVTEHASVFQMTGDGFATPVSGLTSTIPEPLYLLVPALALLGAGYLARWTGGAVAMAPTRSAARGTSVAIGYLALAVAGAFVFAHSRSLTVQGQTGLSVAAGPELLPSILLVGLLYPLVFGTFGAVLAGKRGGTGDAPR